MGVQTNETESPPAAWIERTIRVDDIDWRVCEAGSGPTVLLLHGTGGSVHSWSEFLPVLGSAARLVAVDLPGHGGTSYPGFERISLTGMAQATAHLLAALELAPVAVVAHSAGAAIMLQLALDGALPRSVALIGINPALQAPPRAADVVMQGPLGALLRSRVSRSVVRGAGTLAPVIELLLASTGSRLTPAQEREYVRTFTDPDHAEAAYAMMANWSLRPLVEALPRIAHETLFIVGDRDAWVPPSVAHAAAARMPHARVATVAGAGHLVHEERAGAVAALILPALHHSTSTS